MLAFYNPKAPTVVCIDVSSYGIGGVLSHGHGDQLRSVVFCSRTLTERLRSNMRKSRRSAW